ncbi:MAG TPA: hypothetical protein DIS76_03910 [Rhodospirillaceae bacterium]|nr:hypothetical protein [Rhodospirillaceae bacterium]
MDGVFSLAQIIGYIAFAVTVLAFWQKRDKPLLLLNALACVFWVIHYFMLGAWVGAMTEALVGVRSYMSAYMTDIKHKHMAAAGFMLAFILVGIIGYRGWHDVLNVVACICGTLSMVYLTDFRLRYGMLVASGLWLMYNGLVGSMGGVMAGLILVLTQLLTLIRMYRDRAA